MSARADAGDSTRTARPDGGDPPAFFCPIDPAIHPKVHAVGNRALRWLEEHRFFGSPQARGRVLGTRSAEFYARMAPTARTDRLQIAVEWTYWGFAFDDAYCDTRPWCERPAEFAGLAGRLVRMLEAPAFRPLEHNPYALALSEISSRFAAVCTAVQHRRWVLAHRAWLSGVTWQIGNQARSVVPSLNDYLAMRINSAAGEPVTAMLEMVNGPEIPAHEMDGPAVRACTEMARMLASLDNDLLSYSKDVRGEEADQNVINVISTERHCSQRKAVAAALSVRDRIMCRFLELRHEITPHCSSATRQYLDDLGHIVRGNLDWGRSTPRYRDSGDGPDQFRWAGRPSDSTGRPPATAIAWWWDRELAA